MSRAKTLTGQQGAEAVIGELTKRGHVVKGIINPPCINWSLMKLQQNRWYKLPK